MVDFGDVDVLRVDQQGLVMINFGDDAMLNAILRYTNIVWTQLTLTMTSQFTRTTNKITWP